MAFLYFLYSKLYLDLITYNMEHPMLIKQNKITESLMIPTKSKLTWLMILSKIKTCETITIKTAQYKAYVIKFYFLMNQSNVFLLFISNIITARSFPS